MSDRFDRFSELGVLLADVCDGSLDDENLARLDGILANDPEAVGYYVEYIDLFCALTREPAAWEKRSRERGEEVASGQWLVTSVLDSTSKPSLATNHSPLATSSNPQSPIPNPFLFDTSSPLPSPLFSLPSFIGSPLFSYLVAALLVGLGLLIASVWKLSGDVPPEIAQQPSPLAGEYQHEPEPKVEHVGRITGIVGCRWAQSPESRVRSPALDSRLSTLVSLGDKFALSSGLMEITYNTGAKVILQGPVTYEVDSGSGGFLSLGKLTARVEKRSGRRGTGDGDNDKRETINDKLSVQRSAFSVQRSSNPQSLIPNPLFAVRTPTATVTDLGTEFGVEVSKEGHTASHVFRGSVALQTVSKDGIPVGATRVLHENESAQVEKQSGGAGLIVRRTAADPAAFVRVEQLPKLAEELRLKPYRRWQAYSQELRRDPSLMAYYDFQLREGQPSVLPNVAANGDRSLDGVVENVTWSDGRMVGKRALLFNGPTDYVRVNLPQKVDDLTLAAWVYVESLDNPLNGLLMSDGWEQPGLVAWQVSAEGGSVYMAVFGWDHPGFCSAPVFDRGRDWYRWTHLAMVYDHAAACVKLYVDGQLREEAKVPRHNPICIGSARIGNWNPGAWHTPDNNESARARNFRGRIDELAIFGRPLPSDEIQRMFEVGKPPDIHDVAGHSNGR